MSMFELADGPRPVNGGTHRMQTVQLFPATAAINGTRPGVSGATTGQTTWLFTEDTYWWVPSLSYFTIRGHFVRAATGLALPATTGLGYVDNWPAVLFQQIQYQLNSQTVELLQNPPISDTAITYSAVDRTWLKSFGSANGLGESLMSRIWNSSQFGAGAPTAANYNEVVATFRPALSIFDCPHGIPPGAQHRFDFSWSNNGEQAMIESFSGLFAGVDFIFVLDEFTFHKCSIMPDPSIPLPPGGYIELHPCQVNQYPIVGTTNFQQNVPLPATAERMLFVLQDNNAAINLQAGQNGLKPATDFHASVSTGVLPYGAYITNFYVAFPELQTQAPNPAYNLVGENSAGARAEWNRAYQDWCAVCRGSSGGYEGSLPFGSFDIAIQPTGLAGNTATVVAPNAVPLPVFLTGTEENDQRAVIITGDTTLVGAATGPADLAITAITANQTSLWGWLGRKMMLAAPVIRPKDRLVTNANVTMQFSTAPTSAVLSVITSYSMGIACEMDANGRYQFEILRGL
jgi:hypothetical protein